MVRGREAKREWEKKRERQETMRETMRFEEIEGRCVKLKK
jgi:hypothetical protein